MDDASDHGHDAEKLVLPGIEAVLMMLSVRSLSMRLTEIRPDPLAFGFFLSAPPSGTGRREIRTAWVCRAHRQSADPLEHFSSGQSHVRFFLRNLFDLIGAAESS